jgi:minor curlin subunit
MPMQRFSIQAGTAALASLLLLGGQAMAGDAADIAQIEALPVTGSVANVVQQGNGNDASVSQRAIASGMLDGQNQALITQDGNDNQASITQEGSSNAAEINQKGDGNEGSITQMNSGNGFNLQQSGNGLSVKIEQFGAPAPGSAPISVIQSN